MSEIKLDERLSNDCHVLGRTGQCALLLHRNAAVAWFILVPGTACAELVDMPVAQQHQLLREIDAVANFARDHFTVDKLNIAAIGNIVEQLHVHVVGRRVGDYCWPGVVWGTESDERYSDERVAGIRQALADAGLVKLE